MNSKVCIIYCAIAGFIMHLCGNKNLEINQEKSNENAHMMKYVKHDYTIIYIYIYTYIQ